MRSIFFRIIALTSALSSLFIFLEISFAADSDIVITEIAAYEKTDHEWIEIYNKGSAATDITGWKFLEDNINHTLSAFRGDLVIDSGEYAVIADVAANTVADYPSFTGTLIDSSWQTLNESGEAIALKSASGAIIEQFTYITAPDHSLERKDPALADYTTANWQEHQTGNSIGAAFSQAELSPPPEQQPSAPVQQEQTQSQSVSSQSSSQLIPATPPQASWKAARGDVAINEFVADPTDNEKEWVELYNNSNQTISLDGWTIEDGSKNSIPLKGILSPSANSRFAVFESKDSILNNSGDAILLKDSKGVIIDQVAYGDWDDGIISNNAPRAQDPSSVARFPDGYMSFADSADFKVTRKPTKRESNVLIEETAQQEKDTQLATSVIINELFANPSQSGTSSEEFIELFNQGKEGIELKGWKLETSSAVFTIASSNASTTVLGPQDYIVFSRSQSNLTLKNQGGDTVRLFQKGKERATMSVTYRGDAPSAQSYARDTEGNYAWTEAPSPGKENIIQRTNQPPQAIVFIAREARVGEQVAFDATDSRDPDNDILAFFWNFGDGTQGHGAYATHLFREPGVYQVALTLKAGEHETQERRKLIIKAPDETQPLKTVQQQSSLVHASALPPAPQSASFIIFTEIFPNPKGRDADEFIELYNEGEKGVTLSGWRIEFQSGKNKAALPPITLEGKRYLAISQGAGFRQLRNSSEELLLIDAAGTVVDSIDYEDAPIGQSLARTKNGDWAWTRTTTKGERNSVTIPLSDEGEQEKTAKRIVSTRKKKPTVSGLAPAKSFSIASLSNVKSRSMVRARGRVTVLPGIFDTNFFYIASSGKGIAIKSSGGIFPLLAIGQEIEVIGKLSKTLNGNSVTVAKRSDIKIIRSHPVLFEPLSLSLSAISDSYTGTLIRVSGDIIKVRWPNIYIKEGESELRAYVKKNTGISKLPLLAGQKLRVTGILQKTSTGYRILPSEEKDIMITASPRLAQSAQKEIYAIPAARGPGFREYGTATLVAAIVVFGGLMVRSMRRKKIHEQKT